ncbi:AMP-binding protein [Acuticoccus sp. MNP-M23]|uniref:phenylacetate--CoA ligase family protein n=1 Tax=Acuticoccus sp. MNP-M23 TaxID=3072793 RepID=UPI0028151CE5|nr:AMP-binding protein [Acuticoccus sp. MNP-M23]WMS44368.1 AMP-binding protein [Acuticoccus sp. MNP-M23]
MTDHYDASETRTPAAREAALMRALPQLLATARAKAPRWRAHLAEVDPASVTDRQALAALPVIRKADLMAAQAEAPPFGGFLIVPEGRLTRIFLSPGPVLVPQGPELDPWRAGRALFAAGFRKGERVANTFGYHVTPGAFILESGLKALECPVFAAGPGSPDDMLHTLARVGATAYCGVPDYLNILLERAEAAGLALGFNKALVSGAALPPALRERIEARGVTVAQCYATADLGVVAYESAARDGLIVNEGLILEIVRPGTGEPVPDGEVGEVVVTRFCDTYPMLRLATGDLSAVLPGPSPCGRTNMRLKGWMGRADQRTKVKGMFVDPAQIAEIARRHPSITRARLVVTRADHVDAMTLRVAGPDPEEAGAIAGTMKALTSLTGTVEVVPAAELPNDGKVIADERPVEG